MMNLKCFQWLGRIWNLTKIPALIVIVAGIGIVLLSSVSTSYCLEERNQGNCLLIFGVWPVRSDYLATISTTLLSVSLTVLGFYILEVIKRKDIKPKIKVSFDPKSEEYVVSCKPHYAVISHLVDSNTEEYFAGFAYYVRVKIENEGASSIESCRAFLSEIKKADNVTQLSQGECGKKSKYSDSLPLLWAYENKYDNFEKVYSKSRRYADVLVVYERLLTPQFLIKRNKIDPSKNDTSFLKLKTKFRVDKYADAIEIVEGIDCAYELTVKVFGDEADPQEIKLIIQHKTSKENKNQSEENKSQSEENKNQIEENKNQIEVGTQEDFNQGKTGTINLPDLDLGDYQDYQDYQTYCPNLFDEEGKIKPEIKEQLEAEKEIIYRLL